MPRRWRESGTRLSCMRTILDPMLIVPLRLSSRGRSGSSLWSRLSLDGHKITDRPCRHMCGCLELIRLASTTYIITYTSSMREVLASHLGFNVTLIIMTLCDGEPMHVARTFSLCTEVQVCRRRIAYTLSFVLFSYFLRQRHHRRALCPQVLGEPKDSRIRSNVGTKCCGRGSRR